ncbi:unnamed protein product [Owenia fusiformis]|uniref:Uncharacterized protein n=1 Tax=Owenia fusiformis TaxID=6347 RepID=A0A8J1THK0_OWEFU|nr:unnamed protein product [Owenia fusiformis]
MEQSGKKVFILLIVCSCSLIFLSILLSNYWNVGLVQYKYWIEKNMELLRNKTEYLSNKQTQVGNIVLKNSNDKLGNSQVGAERKDTTENSKNNHYFPVNINISLARDEVKHIQENSEAKYIVYLCPGMCGGWGDRMTGITSTFMWSLVTKRKFVIQHHHPCALTKVYVSNHVNWSINLPKGLTQTQRYLIDNEQFSPKEIGTPNTHIEKRYSNDVIIFRNNIDWIKAFKNALYKDRLIELGFNPSNLSMDYIFPKLHNLLFKPQQELQKKLEDFLHSTKNKSLVCAQIRIGKNPTIPNDPTRNKPEFLPIIWDFLAQYNNSIKYKIFVTTDSENIRQSAKRLFPTTIADTEGVITHTDRSNQNQACQGMQKVALDFNILSHCDVLIISRSNFGEYAARLRNSAKELYGFTNGNIVKGFPRGEKNEYFNRTTKQFSKKQ